jgi:outer membrane protein TolC
LVLLLVLLTATPGCQPIQPFYLQEDGDLSHYLDTATELEDPDVYEPMLADVEYAERPLSYSNPDFDEIWDLRLEEAVSIALQNSKVIRNLGGVTPFGFADALIGRTASGSTIYDTAIVESDPQNGVEAALAAFDAQLSVVGSQNGNFFAQTDRPSTFQANNVIRRDQGGMRTELGKQTAAGTQLFLRNQTDYTRGDNLLGTQQPTDSVWETLFEFEVRQPLARGRGAQINRIPVMLARINTDVSLATFEASVRNLTLDIENTYWDLHCAYRQLETAKSGRDSAQVTWNNVNEKKQAGQESAQAEAQAREQYYFFRAQLEDALRQLYDQENRLRFLMGLAASDGRLIRPVEEPTAARLSFDWRAIHCEALVRSAELRQQKWVIERRELELVAAKNQLLPQLDAGVTYRWFGIGDELINADRNGIDFVATPVPDPNNPFGPPTLTRNPNDPRGPVGSTAFDVLTNGHYQEAAFFLSFQMPVGYRRELAGVRNAQLNLVREKSRLEDIELNASHNLSTAVRALDFNYQAAQTHFNRWRAANEEVNSVTALYEGGLSEIDLVLDAQRRFALAEIDYYRALCDYNKSIVEVHFRKGSLLEYNNIALAEGPWPEKAYWDAMGLARERDASYYLDYGWTRPGVISQGPVPQHTHGNSSLPAEGAFDLDRDEVLPTPEPTPAGPPPGEPGILPEQDDPPRQPGPITELPDGPTLNAPRRAATDGAIDVVADAPVKKRFEWGNLGLEAEAPKTAVTKKPTLVNPLNNVSFEEGL